MELVVFLSLIGIGLLLILILLIYLIDRVRSIEHNSRTQVPQPSQDETAAAAPAEPFGGLSGEPLWKAMTGNAPEGMGAATLSDIRQRYRMILPKHIELTFNEGQSDGKMGAAATPKNSRNIRLLRGQVESWLPPAQIGEIYQCGVDFVQYLPENLSAVRSRLDAACADLFAQVQIDLTQSFSDKLMGLPPVASIPATNPQNPDEANLAT